jgi:hypothetical protein
LDLGLGTLICISGAVWKVGRSYKLKTEDWPWAKCRGVSGTLLRKRFRKDRRNGSQSGAHSYRCSTSLPGFQFSEGVSYGTRLPGQQCLTHCCLTSADVARNYMWAVNIRNTMSALGYGSPNKHEALSSNPNTTKNRQHTVTLCCCSPSML